MAFLVLDLRAPIIIRPGPEPIEYRTVTFTPCEAIGRYVEIQFHLEEDLLAVAEGFRRMGTAVSATSRAMQRFGEVYGEHLALTKWALRRLPYKSFRNKRIEWSLTRSIYIAATRPATWFGINWSRTTET